jgi:hypothetical protein
VHVDGRVQAVVSLGHAQLLLLPVLHEGGELLGRVASRRCGVSGLVVAMHAED